MTREQKRLLKEPAAHVVAMVDFVTKCDEAELRELRDACNEATQTNCPWDVYRAAQFLKNECAVELVTRSKVRASKRHPDLTERGFTHPPSLSE